MKVTTSWSFRRKNLSHYSVADFDNAWDHFLYLHLNRHVQLLHLGGTLIGLCLFPWAMLRLVQDFSIWPLVVYTFFYYGVGFLSHFTGDGQVSQTWRQIFLTYKQAVKMNLLLLRGRAAEEEDRFMKRYPHVMWVYLADAPRPDSQLALELLNESSRAGFSPLNIRPSS